MRVEIGSSDADDRESNWGTSCLCNAWCLSTRAAYRRRLCVQNSFSNDGIFVLMRPNLQRYSTQIQHTAHRYSTQHTDKAHRYSTQHTDTVHRYSTQIQCTDTAHSTQIQCTDTEDRCAQCNVYQHRADRTWLGNIKVKDMLVSCQPYKVSIQAQCNVYQHRADRTWLGNIKFEDMLVSCQPYKVYFQATSLSESDAILIPQDFDLYRCVLCHTHQNEVSLTGAWYSKSTAQKLKRTSPGKRS